MFILLLCLLYIAMKLVISNSVFVLQQKKHLKWRERRGMCVCVSMEDNSGVFTFFKWGPFCKVRTFKQASLFFHCNYMLRSSFQRDSQKGEKICYCASTPVYVLWIHTLLPFIALFWHGFIAPEQLFGLYCPLLIWIYCTGATFCS